MSEGVSTNTSARDEEVQDDLFDSGSFDDAKILDHPPATSQGTYLKGLNDDLESLEKYQDGGYHPIHPGDTLGAEGKYRVIHKLGHGGFGTVWLCRDVMSEKYVAVKVMTGEANRKTVPDLTLKELDFSVSGAESIAIPLDSFSIEGPNGQHQCIVLPVLGPCVSPRLWYRIKNDPALVLRRMAYQAVQAMYFLHKNGLCHGDFRPSNILVRLANLDDLSEEQLVSLLGAPHKVTVHTETGEDLPASSPRYLTHSADITRLGSEYLTEQICVIDFGESYSISSPPADLGIPENYLPPDFLLDDDSPVGVPCDLWALGCTIFEIRQQIPLFYMMYNTDDLLTEMVRFFVKPPKELYEKWEARDDFFDDEGNLLRVGENDEKWSLEVYLSKPCEIVQRRVTSATLRTRMETPEAEQKILADLLYKLLYYEPEKRLTTEEVLAHGWFKL